MQEPNYNHHHSATSFPAINGGGGPPSKRFLNKPLLPPLTVPPGHVCFRFLCHASRVGGVIGKSGSIIRQLQQDTSAKIRVEDSLPPNYSDNDHRVIVIIGRTGLVKTISFSNANNGDGDDDEVLVSSAQEAVVRVFERVIEVAAESNNGFAAGGGGLVSSCRLLVEASQVGAVIGKGGKVVEKIRQDTGCKIKVLTSENLPSDEMVEIEGDITGVKKALVAVTRRLQDCLPAVEKARMTASRPYEATHQENLPGLRMDLPIQRVLVPQSTESSSSSGYSSGDYPLSAEAERIPAMELKSYQQEVIFRILCLNDRVGCVIGKGGSTVRAIQAETSASIIVGPSISECDERLITINAMENADSQESPAQNATVRVFNRCIDADADKGLDSGSRGPPVCARLVVPSSQVGCLLGKGGAIVSEMRRATGASIRVFAGEHVPQCAPGSDEVVQITGELVNVQDALYHVTGRLRHNLFATRMLNGAGNRSSSSCVTESGPLGRARDPPQPGFLPPAGLSSCQSQQNSLTRSMEHLSLSPNVNCPPSPKHWTPQMVAAVDQRSQPDARGRTSTRSGVELGSGDRSAIVTHTTVEIVVPENVIGSVYGDNGGNLVQLRQISGAKVLVHEPRSGTTDRMVVISGSPDETQKAQSLLHAFILAGPS